MPSVVTTIDKNLDSFAVQHNFSELLYSQAPEQIEKANARWVSLSSIDKKAYADCIADPKIKFNFFCTDAYQIPSLRIMQLANKHEITEVALLEKGWLQDYPDFAERVLSAIKERGRKASALTLDDSTLLGMEKGDKWATKSSMEVLLRLIVKEIVSSDNLPVDGIDDKMQSLAQVLGLDEKLLYSPYHFTPAAKKAVVLKVLTDLFQAYKPIYDLLDNGKLSAEEFLGIVAKNCKITMSGGYEGVVKVKVDYVTFSEINMPVQQFRQEFPAAHEEIIKQINEGGLQAIEVLSRNIDELRQFGNKFNLAAKEAAAQEAAAQEEERVSVKNRWTQLVVGGATAALLVAGGFSKGCNRNDGHDKESSKSNPGMVR